MNSLVRSLVLQLVLVASVPCALAQFPADSRPDDAARSVQVRGWLPDGQVPLGPREMESVAFLGVATGPVDATLAAQLGLPEGEGLVVEEVVAGGPAAGALRQHDVLVKLDDQVLVDPRQFAVLVRNHKEGEEVALTYVRAGKEATATIKLGKHEAPRMSQWEDDVPRFGREEVNRTLALMKGPPGGRSVMIYRGGPMPDMRLMGETSVNSANSDLTYKDEQGSLHLTIKDGKRTLVASGVDGKVLFSGPVDTPEERKALPPEVRERFDRIEGMRGVMFKAGRDFEGVETRVVRPAAAPIAFPLPSARPARRAVYD